MYKSAVGILLSTALILFWGFVPLSPTLSASAVERTRPDETVEAYLSACLLEGRTVVDVRAYGLSPQEAGRVYTAVLQADPALFHVAPRLSYAVVAGSVGELVTELYPTYTLSGEALYAARRLYRDTVAGILSEMEDAFADAPPSEAEVVLWIHDYLAERYEYDTRPAVSRNADAYTFFRDGRGVCQAYAMASLALLRAAGLEADFVASPAMDHAWVHVRVEGAWYHMDVTRDDPIPPPGGSSMVTHTRVLRSDVGMIALGYHGFSCAGGHACTDTRYESADGAAVLAAYAQPLRPLTSGQTGQIGHQRVWVGMDGRGDLRAVSVTADGVVTFAPGDMDGDGELTPADLLCLYDARAYDARVPDAWRVWLRARLVG